MSSRSDTTRTLPRIAATARALSGCMLIALLLAGCASQRGSGVRVEDRAPAPPPVVASPQQVPAPTPRPAPGPAAPALPPPAAPQQDPATLALLAQSDRAVQAGNYEEAIAHVERALRIHGDDAELWLRLAELQLAASQPARAEQIAQRGIALAGNRMDWQRRAWLIIADAREAQGDTEEAERIRFQWRSYRG